jgi:hypothetical protein
MRNFRRYIIFEDDEVRLRIYNLSKNPVFDEQISDRQLLKLAMDCLIAYVRNISRKV